MWVPILARHAMLCLLKFTLHSLWHPWYVRRLDSCMLSSQHMPSTPLVPVYHIKSTTTVTSAWFSSYTSTQLLEWEKWHKPCPWQSGSIHSTSRCQCLQCHRCAHNTPTATLRVPMKIRNCYRNVVFWSLIFGRKYNILAWHIMPSQCHWVCNQQSIPLRGPVATVLSHLYYNFNVSVDTIRDAILTRTRKPTWVSLIYHMEIGYGPKGIYNSLLNWVSSWCHMWHCDNIYMQAFTCHFNYNWLVNCILDSLHLLHPLSSFSFVSMR